ncbi:exodeoxyribonuclease V subunit alpha [Bermanella sp. R86510]|uniref:exodeoxyribonuclease V subunit alpha n=1 Tax=unclassified Bermanella TaxID=2627862 RepID=UPI0037C97FEF
MNLQTLLIEDNDSSVRELDKQFYYFLFELTNNEDISLAGLLVSRELGKGNVCLDFRQPHDMLDGQQLDKLFQGVNKITKSLLWPNNECPLVLEGHRLYLQRYYAYETYLATHIEQACINHKQDTTEVDQTLLQALFSSNDNDDKTNEIDWQKIAVCVAANGSFSVISGGPGTGKTTTVIRLLALLIKQTQDTLGRDPIIKLAAPTGKATMRLTESIGHAKASLFENHYIQKTMSPLAIPETAFTLHRLLKRNAQGGFYYNQHNPLHLDILVVDEASMIDLPMMTKLLSAMPEQGRLILLGDKDQLASVEAGSVLADICDSDSEHGYSQAQLEQLSKQTGTSLSLLQEHVSEPEGAAIRNRLCHLRKSYRFAANSGIAALAKAANLGSYTQWKAVLDGRPNDVHYQSLQQEADYGRFIADSVKHYMTYWQQVQSENNDDDNAIEVHKAFNQYRILCAVKDGPLGVNGMNQAIERGFGVSDSWYAGRPVIVLQNDYGLNLYNGDIGIALPVKENQEVRIKVAFITAEGRVRWLQPARLPHHETVFAMTVHKSQGSEFAHCALVLPDYQVPVLTKELIYTGITRAKQRLTLLARDRIVKQALGQQVKRASGLRDRLWEQPMSAPQNQKVHSQRNNQQPDQFSLF